MARTALVTGTSGFIGSHFAERLLVDDWTVIGVDTAPAPDIFVRHLLAEGWDMTASRDIRSSFFVGDSRDYFKAEGRRFDLLVHAAAVIGSRQERDDNPMAVYENLSIDQAAIAWCLRTGTPLLYFSSSAAYPTTLSGPFCEDDIEPDYISKPDAAYGFNKLIGERQCRDLAALGGKVYVVRPFSGYGNDQSLDYPFPSIIARAAAHEDPLTVWSDTERDFIHIDDVVSACLAMIELDFAGPVNIGTGIPTKMSDLARLAANVAGYEPDIKVLGQSVGPDHRYADTTLMRTFCEPEITLEEGVKRALADAHNMRI